MRPADKIADLVWQIQSAKDSIADFAKTRAYLLAINTSGRSEEMVSTVESMVQTCDQFTRSAKMRIVSLEEDLERARREKPNRPTTRRKKVEKRAEIITVRVNRQTDTYPA